MNQCIAVYCAGAWFCVEVFVGQNDAFSCSGQAGRCSGAAARGGAGAVLGHGVARSGGGGGAGMASSGSSSLPEPKLGKEERGQGQKSGPPGQTTAQNN